jgi:hypothetical protein
MLHKRKIDPVLGAEIGVRDGKFISYLLDSFPGLNMYAVDPWVHQPGAAEDYLHLDFDAVYKRYKERTAHSRNRITELRMYSEQAAKYVVDGTLDFAFIDAQHDYDSVMQDIKLWHPKVRQGGILTGHDYTARFPGVVHAVDDFFGSVEVGNNAVWMVPC